MQCKKLTETCMGTQTRCMANIWESMQYSDCDKQSSYRHVKLNELTGTYFKANHCFQQLFVTSQLYVAMLVDHHML